MSKAKTLIGTVREDGAIYSDVWDGKNRWCIKRQCEQCKKEFLAPEYHVKNGRCRFCSKICSAAASQVRTQVTCYTCKKTFDRTSSKLKLAKHGYYFCSRKCKDKAQRFDGLKVIQPKHYSNGKASYRIRALRDYGYKCMNCEYTEDDRMLDVHHIDGDRSNNELDNLKVLCVWCHALETRKNWKSIRGLGVDG